MFLSFDIIIPLLGIHFEQISSIYKHVIFIMGKLSNLNVQQYENT